MDSKRSFASSIKAKLISAVAMLLVAIIMVVSSTYAWFTLSTAPEVSGISTAIGANGALEMRLQGTVDGTTAGENGPITIKNTEWGNLVDLSDAAYGLDKITLLPSTLAPADEGTVNYGAFLSYPTYGADGRPSSDLKNAVTGNYTTTEGGNFYPTAADNPAYGVRAIGVASGLSARAIAYRSAKYEAETAMSAVKKAAGDSLASNGDALGTIVVKKFSSEGDNYTQEELASLEAIITDLNEEDGILEKLENAYLKMILAFSASAVSTEAAYTYVSSNLGTAITFDSVVEADGVISVAASGDAEAVTVDVSGSAIYTGMQQLNATRTKVESAQAAIDALENEATIDWDEISTVLQYLVDQKYVLANNIPVSEIASGEKMSDFVNSVASGAGITVTMSAGTSESGERETAGVYVDIADHCGDFSSAIILKKISYGGMTLENVEAAMNTKSGLTTPYLSAALSAALRGEPNDTDSTNPMSDFYGYIIDLEFRTNVAGSNLLLQTTPKDRIYSDNAEEALTQGGGSNMVFSSAEVGFSNDKIKGIMDAIRIVFFNPANGTIYAEARLDTTATTTTEEGLQANLYIYKDKKFVTTQADAKIVELTQNAPVAVSTLVYLEGDPAKGGVENSDVAAAVAKSVSGRLNLQFASSATLVPMEYGDLHTPASSDGE